MFLLSSCSVPQYSLNNIWRLVELNGEAIPPGDGFDDQIELLFEINNRIDGFGGCNQLIGSYDKNLYDIKFNVSSTLKYCGEGRIMSIEKAFIDMLNTANRYDIHHEYTLYLYKDTVKLAMFEATIIK